MSQTEAIFCYRYPHPAVTTDCVIFGFHENRLRLLLIERGIEPYKGLWALPGGFIKMNETAEEGAARELAEETGLRGVYLTQFHTFSGINRDPRERVITVAFIALVRPAAYSLVAGDDASNALWFDLDFLPPLAFDHHEIIKEARRYLAEVIKVRPIAYELLNRDFSLGELQSVYEAITGVHYDRRNFQRKAMQSGVLEQVGDPAEGEVLYGCDLSYTPAPPPVEYVSPCGNKGEDDRDRPSRGRPVKRLFRRMGLFNDDSDSDDRDDRDNASIKDIPF